jgi:putative Mg2+ transporter-C (MgtC) family protein
VIFKGGTDVRGIKTAAAIWIAGAIGLAIGTSLWWLGAIVGVAVAAILFVADSFPGTREQIEQDAEQVDRKVDRAEQRADRAEQRAERVEQRERAVGQTER